MSDFEDHFAARLLTGIAVGLVLKVGIVGFWALFGLEAILVVSFCVLVTFLPAAVVITDRDRPVGTGIVIGFLGASSSVCCWPRRHRDWSSYSSNNQRSLRTHLCTNT